VADLAGVLAVDDHRVVDLARVDEVARERHRVDEAEARVRDVEVEGGRRQAQPVVDADRDARLEVRARDGRVDEEPDLRRLDARLRERLAARLGGGGVEGHRLVPVAALEHARDALQQARGEAEPGEHGLQAVIDLDGGDRVRREDAGEAQQGGVPMPESGVTVQQHPQFVGRSAGRTTSRAYAQTARADAPPPGRRVGKGWWS
jgi:hypothetical protein